MNIRTEKIQNLVPDDKNANKGTERGNWALNQSIERQGLGRSILLDKDGRIIAGNKTHAKAGELGFEDVLVVPTDGKTLVAVQRTDISLDSPEGRELALADNRAGELGLEWDAEILMELHDEGEVNLNDWFTGEELDFLVEAATEKEEDEQGLSDSPYSKKVQAPIYEPKNEKPELSDCFDMSKADQLIQEIKAAGLAPEDEVLLLQAAQRHCIFNYQRVADYYAHSSPEVQKLMEDSALVIIDFERAIELGYVKLSEEIANFYRQEHGDS